VEPKCSYANFFLKTTRDQLLCICDCAANILDENISLKAEEYKSLEKYQDLLRYLAENKSYFRKDIDKRKYINQSGGFLPLLLATILSASGSILDDDDKTT